MLSRLAKRKNSAFLGVVGLLLLVLLHGCGYTLGSESASIFADAPGSALPTLKVRSIDNPTLFTWLPYNLRNELRDEIAARNLAFWVDSGRADYEIALRLDSYTNRSWVYDRDDAVQLHSADMRLEATVYKGGANEVVWRSGELRYAESYDDPDEKEAADYLILNLVRQLADRMRYVF